MILQTREEYDEALKEFDALQVNDKWKEPKVLPYFEQLVDAIIAYEDKNLPPIKPTLRGSVLYHVETKYWYDQRAYDYDYLVQLTRLPESVLKAFLGEYDYRAISDKQLKILMEKTGYGS